MMKYKVVLEESEEGFAVSVPVLPGCHSQGATEQEALANIADAIREYLEVNPNAVDEFDLEVARTRQNEELLGLLDARAKETELLSLAEVKQKLGL